MATVKFRQLSGLTSYALACGYIQRVEGEINGKEIRVDLWHEGGCYHVRAHDFTEVGRLAWISENLLSDARYHWKLLVNEIFGKAIKEIKKDSRYTVTREFCGEAEPRFITRFCGEHVGKSDTKEAAFFGAYLIQKEREKALTSNAQ